MADANVSSQITEEEAINAYNDFCQKKGLSINAPVRSHRCTPECRMWEYRKNVFVCSWSRMVHRCGHSCQYAEISKGNEGYVCPLTGYVISALNIEMQYIRTSKNAFLSTKLIGDNRFTVPAKKNSRSSKKRLLPLQRDVAESFITEITSGHTRRLEYAAALARYASSIKPAMSAKQQPMTMTIARCLHKLESTPKLLQFPPQKITPTQRVRLASSICSYWDLISLSVPRSKRTTVAFCAAIIGKMRVGVNVNGVQIIPHVGWITRATPPDTNFAGIMGVKCRAVSAIWRKILDKVVSSDTGMPIRNMCFSENL